MTEEEKAEVRRIHRRERSACCSVCGEVEKQEFSHRGGYDLEADGYRWLCFGCDQAMKDAFPILTNSRNEHKLTVDARIKLYRCLNDTVDMHIRCHADRQSHTAKLAGVV